MKWSRELKIAHRSVRTALRAASAMAKARVPEALGLPPWSLPPPAGTEGAVAAFENFGSNPGRLAMFVHVPPRLAPDAPLIVLLHGCGQTAPAFARDTGWMALADRLCVPLVLPEQSDANHRGRCFQWFRPSQVRRGRGEALSIRQMVAAALTRFGADSGRVYIAGLSAGGATAAALLAAYPDVFAAGAVVAGLPVGAAGSTAEALVRMAEAGPPRSPTAWADQVRHAAPAGYAGPWPRLAIWHGDTDRIVDPANARLLAVQWQELHGMGEAAPATADLPAARRESWGPAKRPAVQLWTIPGLAHGWPPEATEEIARFWDLLPPLR